MSIERCEKHGHWDTDFYEQCPNCLPRLFLSFSGGKSSGKMLHDCLTKLKGKYEMLAGFANTGGEWEETLSFVKRCSDRWNVPIFWVEAAVKHGDREASGHTVVTYSNASRKEEPFEEVIKKYGIPNQAWPHCTRELKTNPMYSYLHTIWEPGSFDIAIGMRADEKHRRDKHAEEKRIIYPLMDWWPIDKAGVNDWWDEQSFTLNLQEHQGNCKFCWKKSLMKHFRIIKETPEVYNFTRRMEKDYGMAGFNEDGKPRVFFRGHTSTNKLFEMADGYLRQFDMVFEDPDENSGCSEHCEAFGNET